MLAGAETETAGHRSAGLAVSAERAARAGTGEECAKPKAAAGSAPSAPARGEPTEKATGERDAAGKVPGQGENMPLLTPVCRFRRKEKLYI